MNIRNLTLHHCMIRIALSLFIASFLVFSPTSLAAHPKGQSTSDADYQKLILQYVNEYRLKHHLAPLTMNSLVSLEAKKHSQAMANKAVPFGHQYFDARIHRLYKDIKNCHAGAENVAYYKLDAKKLVDAWIASPGHRRNIKGNYNLTGIGIAHSKQGWAYYTQIFLRADV
ncbi:CAP domain-containing protein [Legionella nagasakiensis]|uniref:CAP domain-containing protein n=1 Tax=Legionella nagasakiensis TaxID=535290 RepID=UPI001F5E7142|nr:CAP domain-containing protein [Legionella nagasakiensis]